MLIKPIKSTRRSRNTEVIPCTHISIAENYSEDRAALLSVEIQICGAPPNAPTRIHMPNDADEVYVMDDSGNHQDSFKWKLLQARAQQDYERGRRELAGVSANRPLRPSEAVR